MTSSNHSMALQAKKASAKLANIDTNIKNELLLKISENIKLNKDKIAAENQRDVNKAQELLKKGELSKPLVNRLILNDEKIAQLSTYLEEVAKLEDPVGEKQFAMKLADKLDLERVTCPIGVIAIIFESRPEVVIQVTALSLKSGNAVILKGGREAGHTNKILYNLIKQVLIEFDLADTVNLIETREDVSDLLGQDDYIDLIIPRGSNEFVRYIQENTKIPVLGHSSGICHLYVDDEHDINKTVPVIVDSKLDYPSACNAVETLLIHKDAVSALLPEVIKILSEKNVQLLGCNQTVKIASKNGLEMKEATEKDWETEYTDLILSIRVVDSTDEAIDHINTYSSHHTDSILTESLNTAEHFMHQIDSGCVFHNVSTRFSDGFVFGLGAEVGISTNKTHSRGPVGLDGMVIYKYILRGNGQIKASFSGESAQKFLHIPLPLE